MAACSPGQGPPAAKPKAVVARTRGGPKTYPVSGQLVWEDGSPARELAGGLVVLESVEAPVSAQGEILDDGTFRLTTSRPGDGALEGRHRVLIEVPRPREGDLAGRREPPPILDPRLGRFETSGLEINVERKDNQVILKLKKARLSGAARKPA
ncbi:MAG TPA: hypothetical protein VNK04_21565 [Gemmataceae bacterium]|nr:hypothetical protein [Gemmataceae bacterium]